MSRCPRILHVEDEADIRSIVHFAFEIAGDIELLQCASAKEALESASDFTPDLFLLDVMMPKMTGNELLVALREIPKFSMTHAVFLTAIALPLEVEKLWRLDVDDIIFKPFDPLSMVHRVSNILSEPV